SVEYDLIAGKRGERHGHAARLLADLASAEDAVVVNNNAAAVLLALAALASRKEVIVARGELVEIGGGFRIPDVLRRSGAKLVEVGTTNRTYARDYAGAIGAKTGAILRVRALRPDKLTIAALLATLETYRDGAAEKELPVWRMIAATPRAIATRARSLAGALASVGIPAEVIELRSTIGGGSLPEETQPSFAVAIGGAPPNRLAQTLRSADPPVISRIVDERVALDLRSVLPEDDEDPARAVTGALAKGGADGPSRHQ